MEEKLSGPVIFQTDHLKAGSIIYENLAIHEGSVTFFCGPSGCGKTTLLRLLNGTRIPDQGTVLYRGTSLSALDMVNYRSHVILAGQNPFLFDGSVRDNFERFHRLRQSPPPSEEIMAAMVRLTDFPFSLDASCHALSGGERQRLFLSMAVSFCPEVLLLDEPTSAMNHDLAWRVMGALVRYGRQRNITIAAVTHDTAMADTLGDAVHFLKGGSS